MGWTAHTWDTVEGVMLTHCPAYGQGPAERFFLLVSYTAVGVTIWILFSTFFHKTLVLFGLSVGFWFNLVWLLIASALLPQTDRSSDMCYADVAFTRISDQTTVMVYVMTFFVIHDFFHHTFTREGDSGRYSVRFRVVGMSTLVIVTGLVAYSLYYIKWNNVQQIGFGAAIGVLNGMLFGVIFHLVIMRNLRTTVMRIAIAWCGVRKSAMFHTIDYASLVRNGIPHATQLDDPTSQCDDDDDDTGVYYFPRDTVH